MCKPRIGTSCGGKLTRTFKILLPYQSYMLNRGWGFDVLFWLDLTAHERTALHMCIFSILSLIVAVTWDIRRIEYTVHEVGRMDGSWLPGDLVMVEIIEHPEMP